MPFSLPPLPYALDALSPHMSKETLDYHYGKHHQTYVTNLNNLVKGTEFEDVSELEDIILNADGAIFNNAAQIWNHTFFWNTLTPSGSIAPSEKILELMKREWGDFPKFQEEFKKAALGNFGSGWTWLVVNSQGRLQILNTSNAGSPLTSRYVPLMVIDVWEHAYYIDHRNARANFIDAFWKIVNWDFVNKNLDSISFAQYIV